MAINEINSDTNDRTARLEREIAALKSENAKLKAKLSADYNREEYSLKDIITLMPGNVFWRDTEGYYVGCNNNVVRLLGLHSPDDIIGKHNKELMGEDIAAELAKTDDDVISSGEIRYYEEHGVNIDKEPAIYLTQKIPLRNALGGIIGILGVSFDITERKKMERDLTIAKEKAEASSRAKSQFLAVVNHELRTPLASIIGLVDFLKQDNLAAHEKHNIVEAIENCSKHLLSLVNDVLDFSRLETGKHNLRVNSVNLHALVQEVYSMLNTLAQKKGLALKIELGQDLPKNILTDPRILRQILINLISNAIKFTEIGSVILQIQTSQTQTHNKVQLLFNIIDTGSGIPHEKLDLIFEPFQQLEDAYARQSSRSGTGLGLAIVKKLATLINAKIQVESEPGKGSVFTLKGKFEVRNDNDQSLAMLIKTEKNKQQKQPKLAPLYPNTFSKKPRILLIEDDPIVQYVHKKMLIDLGCEVDAFFHGQKAISHLNHDHDIAFIDISLPDVSGFEVIEAVRQQCRENKIAIVALTVYTGKKEKIACLKAGADEFASKPISLFNLKKLLLRHLNKPA